MRIFLKSDANANSLVEKIQQLQDKAKKTEKELQALKEKSAMKAGSDIAKSAVEINGVSVIVQQLENMDVKSLRVIVDDLKNQLGSAVIAFVTKNEDRLI